MIDVYQNYTPGQTAQAIISSVTNGWFADSIGAFYKKYRFAKTGNLDEFREWQKGSAAEAAQLASGMAELYVNSLATLTPSGDLVVTIGDLTENGPGWHQLLSILPLLSVLPVGVIYLKLGDRQVKVSKFEFRSFMRLAPRCFPGLW